MKLRRRLFLYTTGSLIVTSIALVAVQFFLVGPYLDSMENDRGREKLAQLNSIISGEALGLVKAVKDWARWDPTYDYVHHNAPGYEAENLNTDSFKALGITHLAIFNEEGIMRWGGKYYPQGDNLAIMSRDNQLQRMLPDLAQSLSSGREWGFSLLAAEWYLLAAQRISSPSTGKSAGILVMTRPLDADFFRNLEEKTGMEIRHRPLRKDEGLTGPKAAMIREENNRTIMVAHLEDTWSEQWLRVEASYPRDLEAAGLRSLATSAGGSLAVLMVFTVFGMRMFARTLVRPLVYFASRTHEISSTGNYGLRIEWKGNDEIALLAHGINELVRTAESTTVSLTDMAATDPLTGIANRRTFDQALDLAWKVCKREKRPLGIVMSDVDHFKAFNDNYGHRAGDVCLKAVAGILEEVAKRPGDVVARYGGEEFVLVLPGTDARGTMKLASDLCKGTRELAIPHKASAAGIVTISAGWASILPGPDSSPEQLVEAADKALYRAKEAGRNRIDPDRLPEA